MTEFEDDLPASELLYIQRFTVFWFDLMTRKAEVYGSLRPKPRKNNKNPGNNQAKYTFGRWVEKGKNRLNYDKNRLQNRLLC